MSLDATELRRLHEAASPGPWRLDEVGWVVDARGHVVAEGHNQDDELAMYLRNHVLEILAALEDRDRVEWLDQRVQRETVTLFRTEDDSADVTFYTSNFEMDADTLREAIDAARGGK